mgnify:CR=1 FL=1
MNIIFLSGTSGKQLWPLTNDLRSSQFIKILKTADGSYESIFQRTCRQIQEVDPSAEITVAATKAQASVIHNQMGSSVDICMEPMRKNTFSVAVLAAAYLRDVRQLPEDSVAVACPVDAYVGNEYFETLLEMAEIIERGQANLALLGIVPAGPNEKYGYIVPEKNGSEPFAVKGFREKPDEATAQELVDMGALWNCGVFCFKLNMAAQWLDKYGVTTNYDEMVADYEKLPKQSFDYEVLEHWKNIVAIQYDGIWKDLGTWNTLTEEMKEQSIGDVTWDKTCENSHAINVLGVPMVVMGAKNMVVVASHDGILVADKHQSSYIKDCLENIPDESRFEERRWGTIKTIDNNDEDGTHSVTKRIKILAGKTMPYHTHAQHTETITVISGMGKLILEGTEVDLLAGSTVSIASGKKHSIKALGSDLRLIEVSLGVTCDDEQVLG